MRALYTAATGMRASQTQIENIANNLANASTTGFKKARETFADLVYQTVGTAKDPMQLGGGSRIAGLARDFRNGDTIVTSSQTDLLVDGPGFFVVQTAAGETRYTRDGHFRVNVDGQLTTQDGSVIQPEIQLDPGDKLEILGDGTIWRTYQTDNGEESVQAGVLSLATFANPGGLVAMGGNVYQSTTASGEAMLGTPGEGNTGGVVQGALEGSNVDAAEELVNMITAQRGYELSSKVIQAADEMMQTAVSIRR